MVQAIRDSRFVIRTVIVFVYYLYFNVALDEGYIATLKKEEKRKSYVYILILCNLFRFGIELHSSLEFPIYNESYQEILLKESF